MKNYVRKVFTSNNEAQTIYKNFMSKLELIQKKHPNEFSIQKGIEIYANDYEISYEIKYETNNEIKQKIDNCFRNLLTNNP